MTSLGLGEKLKQYSFGAQALGWPVGGGMIFVDSANGADGNEGEYPHRAVKTLTRALELATDGDVIVCAPGGSETVTASLAVSKRVKIFCPVENPQSGFSVIGAGALDLMTVSAADVHIEGLRFARSAGAGSTTAGILTTAAADRLTVKRCSFDYTDLTSSWTNYGIELTDDIRDVRILDCVFRDCHRAILGAIATAKTAINWLIQGCAFFVGQATAFGLHVSPAGTGALAGLIVKECVFIEADGDGSAATDVWDGTNGTDAASGPILFGAGVDQYLIAHCAAYTALAQTFDTLNAINAGALGDLASNNTGVGGASASLAAGEVFWLKKTLTSSAVPQAGVDVTGLATGELAVEDVVVKTDGTGLAGGTNFELETNNAKGLADFFVSAVSGLGANKTIDLDNASVTKIRTIIEQGKKVIAKMSAADGTGAGTADVYLKLRRLSAGATIAAA